MTVECVRLGATLSEHFRVYLPLLFGDFAQPPSAATLLKACISREIHCLACGTPSPITDRLRVLCQLVYGECGGNGIGVIGMCLTGGFTLTLMLEPSVVAPILSQPSLPLPVLRSFSPQCVKASLGTNLAGLVGAAKRDVEVLGLRFTADWRCPAQRFESLSDLFGPRFRMHLLPSGKGTSFPSNAHSVLTYRESEPSSPAAAARTQALQEAYEQVLSFLKRQLR